MTAASITAHHHHPRQGTSRRVRHVAQFAALVAGLIALGALFLVAAAPGGAALRPSPPSNIANADPAVSAPVRSPPVRVAQHLVLLVDDAAVEQIIEARRAAEVLIAAERGAASGVVTFEVIQLGAHDDLSSLLRGLDEFDQHCGPEPCPTILVIDLRSGPPGALGRVR